MLENFKSSFKVFKISGLSETLSLFHLQSILAFNLPTASFQTGLIIANVLWFFFTRLLIILMSQNNRINPQSCQNFTGAKLKSQKVLIKTIRKTNTCCWDVCGAIFGSRWHRWLTRDGQKSSTEDLKLRQKKMNLLGDCLNQSGVTLQLA